MPDRFTHDWERDPDVRKGKRMGTLWADMDCGEGEVTLNILLDEESDLFRADVIQDWIGLLQREYDLAIGKVFPTEEAKKSKAAYLSGHSE